VYRRETFIDFAHALYTAYKDFWGNPIITPQEQCDLLGDSASDLFTKHAIGVQFILENMPNITDYIPDFMDTTHIPTDKKVNIVENKIVITDKILTNKEDIDKPLE